MFRKGHENDTELENMFDTIEDKMKTLDSMNKNNNDDNELVNIEKLLEKIKQTTLMMMKMMKTNMKKII